MDMPQISVVIPTYNRAGSLACNLESLCQQTLPPDAYEVLVMDDGSTDHTAALVQQFDAPYHLRYGSQAHKGPAAARNRGAEMSRAPLILFFDDDVVATPGLLAAHVAAHEKHGRGAVFGYTPFADDLPGSAILDYHRCRWEGIFADVRDHQRRDGELPFNFFITLNISVRRTDFEALGPFDEDLSAVYEDTELGLRFHDAGVPIYFCEDARALHYPHITVQSIIERRDRFGFLAGQYYRRGTHKPVMNTNILADYVLGTVPPDAPLGRRLKIWIRDRLVMTRPAAALCLAAGQIRPLPLKLRFYLLHLVSLYWYRRGFRRALAVPPATGKG